MLVSYTSQELTEAVRFYGKAPAGNKDVDRLVADAQAILKFRMEESLRYYERAHATYMETPVFDTEAGRVKAELKRAERAYLAEVKAQHPTWIVL
jgi:hypothetical protein